MLAEEPVQQGAIEHDVAEGGKVQATWSVLPGHGTGELRGLRGSGGYVWEGRHGQPTSYTLDYYVE